MATEFRLYNAVKSINEAIDQNELIRAVHLVREVIYMGRLDELRSSYPILGAKLIKLDIIRSKDAGISTIVIIGGHVLITDAAGTRPLNTYLHADLYERVYGIEHVVTGGEQTSEFIVALYLSALYGSDADNVPGSVMDNDFGRIYGDFNGLDVLCLSSELDKIVSQTGIVFSEKFVDFMNNKIGQMVHSS